MHKTSTAFVCSLAIVLLTVVSCFAQDKYLQKRVSGNFQNLSIDSVLDDLASQCACYFSYNADIIDGTKQVSFHCNDKLLNEVLDSLFSDDIYFNEFKNQIIFSSKAEVQISDTVQRASFYTLSGNILDSITNESLPFVTVAIAGEFYGTVSNLQGAFSLKVPERFYNQDLVFSSIGYYNYSIKVSSFKDGQNIKMLAAVVSLQEVMVRSVGATLLLRKALTKFDDNYYQEPYNYTAFYRESTRKDDKFITYSEALLEGYKSKMKYASLDRLVLEKARKYSNINETDTLLIKLKGGMDACIRLDIVRHVPDFIDSEGENMYEYTLRDVRVWEDKLVHVLAFKPRSGAIDAFFEGELFIGVDDLAILGAEFGYAPEMMGKIRKTLVLSKSNGIKVKPLSTTYFLKYNQWNGKYFIQHVRGEMVLKAKQRKQLKYANYYTNLEMIVTQIDTQFIEKPARRELMKTETIFSEYNASDLQQFWEFSNTILPEQNIMKAFNKSGFQLDEEF